ncbi:MAG TPA: T9SS type A sorting domain-containing protein, partial [Flavobacteriales bacterium]|nr:T9SS type A sorting domain-containing protein [Flavobacteriales bacterium]
MTITSNTATNNSLTVSSSRTLNVTGQLLITKAAPGTGAVGMTLSTGAVNCGSLIVDGTASAAQNGFYRSESNTGTTTVNGNLTIESGGLLDLQLTATSGGVLRLHGDWTNNDGTAAFQEGGCSVQFLGVTNDQAINTVDASERFYSITLNKPAFDVVLNDDVSLGGTLLLLNGHIASSTPAMFTMEAGSSTSAGTDASHVSGPMEKIGSTDLTFPIGKGGQVRPISITGITAASTYTAEYFPLSARTTFGTATDGTLDHVSDCEYWQLAPSSASTANITMTWDTPNSCGVTLPGDLRIANWSGGQWNNRGNTATSPMGPTGSLSTSAVQSTFGPFTLASVSSQNPLPIQLLHFGAVPDGREVALEWTTSTETDNAYFTVERSSDLQLFAGLLQVPGAGNSQQLLHYTARDPFPFMGLGYYRLRQTDFNGASTVSDIVPVLMNAGGNATFSAVRTEAGLLVTHDLLPGSTADVLDATGRVLWNGTLTGSGQEVLHMPDLGTGIYLLRLTNGARVEVLRFVE